VRWLKFNAVGAIGIVVQLATLAFLKSVLNANYLVATTIAVEAALVHNFFWHEAFTWSDRERANRAGRLLKFNLTTGAVSIGGNVFAMKLLVGIAGVNYLPASLLSITACSLLNFVIADQLIFVSSCGQSNSRRFCEKWK
jgi:putative flippase GtrA